MTRERNFYRNFFCIYFPLVMQNILVLSVNLADNIMLGAYSESALSGVAAVNQIQFILQQVMMGIGDTLVVLGSQYWGQKRMEPIRRLAGIAIKAGLLLAALLFLVVSLFPHAALSLFTTNEVIIGEGMRYLNIIRFTYLIFALTIILLAALRTVETVKIAFYISISTLILNCSINYVLIYGKFGAPELGAEGAAIGTLAARSVELVIVLIYIAKKDQTLKLRIRELLPIDRELLLDYIRVGTPILVVTTLWGMSTALQTVILGHMQANAIAANAVASTLFLILKVASVGAAATASIIIGKTVGMGNFDKIKEYTKTLQIMFLCIGILTSISLFFIRIPVLSLYNLTPETKEMANAFLLVLCVTCIGTSYQMPVFNGIIRGGGDARFVMINDIISIWGIVLPLSFLAAFKFGFTPVAVICCLNSDQIFKCAAAFIRVNGYRWVRKLTRE